MSQQVELACRSADTGSFDGAVALCLGVTEDRLEYAACRSLLGSVYRQVGLHAVAQPFDEQGIGARVLDPLGLTMCRLGLAADRIGVGDLAGAQQALRGAEVALEGIELRHWAARWFDPWLTHAWVSAETCLLADEPAGAVAVLEPFAQARPPTVPHSRWPTSQAKTLLFLGVAQRCVGDTRSATRSLRDAARIAVGAGLAPLLVPAVEQLAQLDPAGAADWADDAVAALDHLHRHRPPEM